MIIEFNKITIKNFFSYEYAELSLNTSGYTFVKGENKNTKDSALSNGSGKSSIFDAISWCLTGETIREAKKVKRIGSSKNDECCVSLNFICDGKSFSVTRYYEPSNLKIFIDGEDKSGKGIRDGENILNSYLPFMSPSFIGSVIILGQGMPQRFSNNTPSGRKEVLEKLSTSDIMISMLKEKIKNRLSSIATAAEAKNKEYSELTSEKLLCEKTINQSNIDLGYIESDDDLIHTMDSLSDEHNSILLDIEKKENESSNLSSKIHNANSLLSVMHEKKEVEKTNKTSEIRNKINELKIKLVEVQSFIRSTEDEIKKHKSVKDICPTCGQKLIGVIKIDTAPLESKLRDFKNDESELLRHINSLLAEEASVNSLVEEEYKEKSLSMSEELSSLNKNYDACKVELKNLKLKESNLNLSISGLNAKIQSNRILRESLEKKIVEYTKRSKEVENKILYNSIERQNLSDRESIVNKMSSAVSKEFRSYLISSVVSFVNERCVFYSKQVFEEKTVNVAIDGNNILITFGEVEYDNLSGGEKQKIDLIVQLAIRDMMCSYSGFNSNLLVLDEITDNMDSCGVDKIMNLLSSNLSDVSSIFIISHHNDICIPYDNEVVVRKNDDGISVLV